MWYVAYTGIAKENRGMRLWTAFDSKEESDKWNKEKMLDGTNRPVTDVYQIIYEGENETKAKRACGLMP